MEEDEKFVPVISFVAKRSQKSCYHKTVVVDEEKRAIECSACGIVMDPFDFLLKTCYQDESAFDMYVALKTEVDKKQRRLHNLEKEIERLNKVKKILTDK